MNSQQFVERRMPARIQIGLAVGWILIAVKALATPWAIAHWQVPIHPAWVIIPTLIMAVLATALAVTHNWSADRD